MRTVVRQVRLCFGCAVGILRMAYCRSLEGNGETICAPALLSYSCITRGLGQYSHFAALSLLFYRKQELTIWLRFQMTWHHWTVPMPACGVTCGRSGVQEGIIKCTMKNAQKHFGISMSNAYLNSGNKTGQLYILFTIFKPAQCRGSVQELVHRQTVLFSVINTLHGSDRIQYVRVRQCDIASIAHCRRLGSNVSRAFLMAAVAFAKRTKLNELVHSKKNRSAKHGHEGKKWTSRRLCCPLCFTSFAMAPFS